MPRPDGMDVMLGAEQEQQGALSDLKNLESGFSGINNAGDVRSRFGVTSTKSTFAPLYQRLANRKRSNMRGAALRMGRNVSPGMSFSDVDQSSEDSLLGLMGQEGSAEQEQQRFVAGLLQNAIGSKDQFGLNKATTRGNMASSIFGNRLNLEQFNRAGEGPGLMDIIGSVLGGISSPLSALLSPKPTTNIDMRGR